MEENRHGEKMGIAWAAVFLTAVIAVFLVSLFAFTVSTTLTIAIGITLFAGGAVSVLTVVLLLSASGSGPALLTGGRILLWVSMLCVAAAAVMGIVMLLE